jgi:hypothetical protein
MLPPYRSRGASASLPTIWDFLSASNVSARYYYDGETFQQTPLFLSSMSLGRRPCQTSAIFSPAAATPTRTRQSLGQNFGAMYHRLL